MAIIYVTGGAKSGKSKFAEDLLLSLNDGKQKNVYLATSVVFDEEMQKKVELHKARRKDNWITVESYKNFSQSLEEVMNENKKNNMLVDCLTNMISNIIFENEEIYLKIVKEIRGINHIVFENKNLGIIKRLNLSTEAILSISNDNISFFPEEITSKENIVKNQNSDETNPKIIKFNGEKIKNPIVYEILYKGYMFKLIGNENLYQNQEIKDLIVYLKSLEQYM